MMAKQNRVVAHIRFDAETLEEGYKKVTLIARALNIELLNIYLEEGLDARRT